ncbi:MAG: hypothetical protein KDC83_13880 [Flavobacteriales bacterium]|nr:hypothetical protein [Flavobacteriales bacterium]
MKSCILIAGIIICLCNASCHKAKHELINTKSTSDSSKFTEPIPYYTYGIDFGSQSNDTALWRVEGRSQTGAFNNFSDEKCSNFVGLVSEKGLVVNSQFTLRNCPVHYFMGVAVRYFEPVLYRKDLSKIELKLKGISNLFHPFYKVNCLIDWNNYSFRFSLPKAFPEDRNSELSITLIADTALNSVRYFYNNLSEGTLDLEVKKTKSKALKVEIQSLLELKNNSLLDGPLRGEFTLRGFEMQCYE